MPVFDGRGPRGLGPRTGRGLGPCGWSLGYRRFYSQSNELAAIKEEIKMLEEEIDVLRKEKEALENSQK